MNKKNKLLLLFLIMCLNLFSLSINDIVNFDEEKIVYWGLKDNNFNYVYFTPDKKVEFNSYIENTDKNSIWSKTHSYEFTKKGDFFYLELKDKPNKKYLVLISKLYIIIYDTSNSKSVFFGINKKGGRTEALYNLKNVTASSELVEGEKIYKASNMENWNLDEPWVEGKKGYGIGEKIYTSRSSRSLTFCLGYISAKKPYLWRQNSRPKTLLITCKEKGFSKKIELKDTPNPQTVIFDGEYLKSFEITILDVYKGTKYDDTCIHFITAGELSLGENN